MRESANVAHVELPASVRSVIAPPEDLLPHQWTEKYRRLHEKDAAQSGPFSFDRIPYMVEPTDRRRPVESARTAKRYSVKNSRTNSSAS